MRSLLILNLFFGIGDFDSFPEQARLPGAPMRPRSGVALDDELAQGWNLDPPQGVNPIRKENKER
jgi:hypothetical protein